MLEKFALTFAIILVALSLVAIALLVYPAIKYPCETLHINCPKPCTNQEPSRCAYDEKGNVIGCGGGACIFS